MEKNLNLKEYIPCNEALCDPITFFAQLKTGSRSLLPWEHALMQEITGKPYTQHQLRERIPARIPSFFCAPQEVPGYETW